MTIDQSLLGERRRTQDPHAQKYSYSQDRIHFGAIVCIFR
jgi:hypothetical protein